MAQAELSLSEQSSKNHTAFRTASTVALAKSLRFKSSYVLT